MLKVELNLNTNGEQKSTLVKSVIFTIVGGFFSLLLGLLILSEMKTNFPSNLVYIILIFVFFFAFAKGNAQILEPVKWTSKIEKKGNNAVLIFY